ncbi:carbohydrate ABC transporter permease [Lederbergia lenta]|uniref:Sugar ABC transporter permease n=1 Tax=Lederbergia lenta TaxID=1467 RepID=A0A2X4WHF8_LEDLE|nr:carbohydrate ABC transporter permease [Lederbergia lenta]MCM3111890.1 carbohydrate ABC transporter permease [Lederbergia lenta]MEC2323044.1 carbohydrate ABC transporter permease [Lederbergia lenta]SQI62571.1 sugar ABC transporter permease [Lederbergia lenta]
MNVIKKNKADRIFDTFNYTFMTILILIVLYPLYLIVISSVSNPYAVNSGTVWLIPEGFTMEGYKKLFEFGKVWIGYRNSLFYAVFGTVLNLSLTLTAGYALSRHDLVGRNFFMFIIAFTMFFGGGIIPTYLLVKDLGMVNTIWSQVIPNAVSAFNIIIARTFFQTTIPKGLLEAAQVDGCTTTKFFFKIVLPLSVPIIAVIALFSAVAHWNSYFQALIYLRDESLYPLQIILREILIVNESQGDTMVISPDSELQDVSEIMKYGAIIVTSLPVLILYPFVQKYFVKGVMIGSIKE